MRFNSGFKGLNVKLRCQKVKSGNVMTADGSNVFFFPANSGRPDKHTSLATSRIVIGGVLQHSIQSMVLIIFIFNAGDSRMEICPRSELKQPSFPDIHKKN